MNTIPQYRCDIMSPATNAPPHAVRRRMVATVAAAGLFALLCGGLTVRLASHAASPGETALDYWGLADFRDAVYFPAKAFLEGNDPYDVEKYMATYPVGNTFPLYSPLALLLHLPYALLRFDASQVAYVLFNLALLIALAYFALRLCRARPQPAATLLLASLLLVSQPGRANFNAGQVALPMVLGVLVALSCAKTRPNWAGLGLALTTLKPTFGVPLAILMLARKDYRAVAVGMAVGLLGALLPLAVILAHEGGIAHFWQIAVSNQRALYADTTVDPSSSRWRLDAVFVLCRMLHLSEAEHPAISLLVPLIGLSAAAVAVRKLANAGGDRAADFSLLLISLAILATVYHLLYDGLLLAAPLLAVAAGREDSRRSLPPPARWLFFGLLFFPMVNVSCTQLFTDLLPRWLPGADAPGSWSWHLRDLFCAANGLVLLAAFVLGVAMTFTRRPLTGNIH
ncbi:MAG: glycosyltransferase family 87 protein [Thermoguttaceae bacterium]